MRGLVEIGVLPRDGTEWRVTESEAATDIPASVQALLLARMDRLPREVRTLAQEAAVIGPRFEATLLGATATDPANADTGLDILCDAEVIEEVAGANSMPSRAYRFTQTLLHDVIYQNLLLQRRTDMHGRIGAALEQTLRRQSGAARRCRAARPSFQPQREQVEGRALSQGSR